MSDKQEAIMDKAAWNGACLASDGQSADPHPGRDRLAAGCSFQGVGAPLHPDH